MWGRSWRMGESPNTAWSTSSRCCSATLGRSTVTLAERFRSGGPERPRSPAWTSRCAGSCCTAEIAIDYLDRCIDMLRAYSAHQRVGTPAEVGLPPYVIATFKRLESKQIERARTGRMRRVPCPSIRIDPWAPFGPELELPQVPFDLAGATWRMVAGFDARRVPASAHEGSSADTGSRNRVERRVVRELSRTRSHLRRLRHAASAVLLSDRRPVAGPWIRISGGHTVDPGARWC